MSTDEKTPPGGPVPGGALSYCEEGPAKAPEQANTPPDDVLEVHWKSMKHDTYFVLATMDGKAAGWAARELDHDGKERFRYGVGGLTDTAKTIGDARSIVISRLTQSCADVGMTLVVRNVERRDDVWT